MRATYRFTNLTCAKLVCNAVQRLISGADASVVNEPVTPSERQRGVGDWGVQCSIDDIGASWSFDSVVNEGLMLALAEALTKHDPHHPLITGTWRLRPENVPIRPKHKIVGLGDYMRQTYR